MVGLGAQWAKKFFFWGRFPKGNFHTKFSKAFFKLFFSGTPIRPYFFNIFEENFFFFFPRGDLNSWGGGDKIKQKGSQKTSTGGG